METIGNRLKKLRKELNLKQGQFAQGIGLKQGSYSEIENEKEILTQKNIEFICLKYGVNINWLKNGDGQMFINQKLTHEESELLEIYDKLDPEMQKETIDYAKKMLELQEFRKKLNINSQKTAISPPPQAPGIGPRLEDGQAG